MVNRKNIQSIYRTQISHSRRDNQTDIELRNRTVGLHQQVQHSHHAQIPNLQLSEPQQMHPGKSYSTYRLQHHLRKWRHPWKNQWPSQQNGSPFQSTIIATIACLFSPGSPQRTRASSSKRFLDHTQWRTTVGRTPLDEWSALRRDLYLTTHNTQNRQSSKPTVGFEPTISGRGAAVNLSLKPRGHWDRHYKRYYKL